MRKSTLAQAILLAALSASAVTVPAAIAAPAVAQTALPAMTDAWTGPFGGVPDWQAIKVEEFPAALQSGMEAQRAAIKTITDNAGPASFDNTIAALEKSSRMLDRVFNAYGVHSSVLDIGDMPKIEEEMAPKIAAYGDEINQNIELFKRVEAVYNGDQSKLTAEQKRLTWIYYSGFVRAGAKLDLAQKARVAEINQRLATLFTQFSQNVQQDEQKIYTVVDSESDLAGLPDDVKANLAAAAERRGMAGHFVINNTRSAMDPVLTYASNRSLREKVWRAFVNRGDNATETDNNKIISEILKLRFERAQLLGYKNHAAWRVEQEMAGTPESAVALMEGVWKPAVKAVERDVADMQKIADAEESFIKIAPWDYRFYAEKLRKAKYDLDMNEVKAYMQLDKMREAMFWAAGQLYGYQFKSRPEIKTYHPDVKVWEVADKAGKHVGLWYFDPYARDGKRSGAWMNAYRNQERFEKPVTTIVSNNSNFVKGKDGEPVLISWDDAETMFHEFGHALHGLSSNVSYPSVSGTSVARDFVEFPSQINEHWLSTPEVLNKFALHYKTGKPIPADLIAKIKRTETFNEGFRTMEYLASAMIDMKLHLAGGADIDADKFEREELQKLGMPKEIVMRHRTPQFLHVFSSDGYSAGYYAYLWADSLTADAFEAFSEGKGAWDKSVAERFKKEILSVGNTRDQKDSFRAFRGRDVSVDALMRKRGFAEDKGASAGTAAGQ